jgi:prepilin-type processing-associated H-X9-DG protein
MRLRSRPGFTLIQLLVILAILAILAGLLLPAIQKARMAAERMKSQNNLKQMGLACHNYHDVNGSFPPGVDPNSLSAAAYLLPYLEQDNLFKTIDFSKPPDDEANKVPRGTTLAIFLSGRDPLPTVKPGVAATNYLFSAGAKPDNQDNDGIYYQESKVRIADITDGTSNTVMIGETLKGDGRTTATDVRRQHVLLDKEALKDLKDETGVQEFKDNKHIVGDRCSSWLDGRFMQGTFNGMRRINDPRPDVSCEGFGGLGTLRSFDTIVNAAFCDGSVRALSNSVDDKVWKALMTRNGGEVVQLDN